MIGSRVLRETSFHPHVHSLIRDTREYFLEADECLELLADKECDRYRINCRDRICIVKHSGCQHYVYSKITIAERGRN
jgi:hypothetical protein